MMSTAKAAVTMIWLVTVNEPGDHVTEHVARQHEHEQREHEREELHAFLAHHAGQRGGDEFVGHLGERL